MPTVDFVVPVYNEQESLLEFHKQLVVVRLPPGYDCRYLYINDGSSDKTKETLEHFAANDDNVSVLQLSRNFGKEAALSAGLEFSTADIVITMDGDGQHPPSLIPEMLRLHAEGHDIVRALRADDSASVGPFKRLTSRWFYRIISIVGEVDLVVGTSDFRLHSRLAVDALLRMPEYHRFYRGMTAWIGFPSADLHYKPSSRIGGDPKYSLRKMLRLAGDGFFSFSLMPLRIALLLGLLFMLLAGTELLYVAYVFLSGQQARLVPGWTSLILILTVSSAINMVLLGILGAYIGMMFQEVKRRPAYLIKSTLNGSPRIRRTDKTKTSD